MKFLLAFIILAASVAPAQAQVFWYPNAIPRYYAPYPVYRPYYRAYRRAYRPMHYPVRSWNWRAELQMNELNFQIQTMNDNLFRQSVK